MIPNPVIFLPFFNDKPQIILPQGVSISVFIALTPCRMICKLILDFDELTFVENGWSKSVCMTGCSY